MAKTLGTKPATRSLNQDAPARPGSKGAKSKTPKGRGTPAAGRKGGQGDIQAKQANTSSAKKSASK